MKHHQKAIKEIIDGFDFEKVQTFMALTNWAYFDSPDTPTLDRLKKTAISNLKSVLSGRAVCSASGGFRASKYHEDGCGQLTLEFVAVQNITYLSEEN